MKLKKILALNEAGMGSAEYQPPHEASQLMADFYTLGMMAHGPQYVTSIHQDGLDYEFKDVERTLLPYMREHLLQMAGYSIFCELRHAFNYDAMDRMKIDERDTDAYYKKLLAKFASMGGPPDAVKQYEYYLTNDAFDRPQRDEVADVTNHWADLPKLIPAAKAMFDGGFVLWLEGFGGKPWADACDAWMKLYNAHSIGDMYVYIDKMYDLQHNNGALLDKNPEYSGKWLGKMLDLKLEAKTPEVLIQHCSGYMRKLSTLILKAQHGRGWDHGYQRQNSRFHSDYPAQIRKAILSGLDKAGVRYTNGGAGDRYKVFDYSSVTTSGYISFIGSNCMMYTKDGKHLGTVALDDDNVGQIVQHFITAAKASN